MNWLEVIDQLKDELLADKTGTQIAEVFGCTRNAVISAVHRYKNELGGVGLATQPGRRSPTPGAPLVKSKPVGKKLVRGKGNKPEVIVTRQLERPMSLDKFDRRQVGTPLVDKRLDQCCWPVSPNDAPMTLFCEGKKVDGSSYCATHRYWNHRSNYNGVNPDKNRRRDVGRLRY